MNWQLIAGELARWHSADLRDLPWRSAPAGRRDPYAVWISEVMAQQTRLTTVVDYFNRWMRAFPTVQALAVAEIQAVLRVWEGLGYYARARNLHGAANIVVDRYGGELPRTRKELIGLPGIGEYTAGAILSLAYGQRESILDGNAKRVFSRLADIEESVDESATVKRMWTMAQELVSAAPQGAAGVVNEALMELGSTVCTQRAPRCLVCPLQANCAAYALGTQSERPIRSARAVTPHYDVAAGVIWEAEPLTSRVLVAQRPLDGMLGGLWEFPGGKLEPDDVGLEECLRREICEELGIAIDVLEPIVQVQHAYTHFRITLHAFHARHVSGTPGALQCADWRWAEWRSLPELPFAVTDRRIIRSVDRQLKERGTHGGISP
jgi:A/G-specific adenine glycosylase